MRQAYAHDAVVALTAGGDERAPGGAITRELCGSLEHEPPCPLASHYIGLTRDDHDDGDTVRLRVLFAAEPADEPEVRRRIGVALRSAELTGPDGLTTRWRLRAETAAAVRPGERDHAARLAR
ncbi:hypothetical protein [Jiangella anatolica]|uniref:Uncharacterized protein n=1 Tax=Jiangella anatolica TaxID=2670374 RepID=A0A2W2B418_9ACTN|nr:hypothetical protein [Jiangella anatolica]PZF82115.1 hypothetical protein C1I92_18060 [Jiangella anatolica]